MILFWDTTYLLFLKFLAEYFPLPEADEAQPQDQGRHEGPKQKQHRVAGNVIIN